MESQAHGMSELEGTSEINYCSCSIPKYFPRCFPEILTIRPRFFKNSIALSLFEEKDKFNKASPLSSITWEINPFPVNFSRELAPWDLVHPAVHFVCWLEFFAMDLFLRK